MENNFDHHAWKLNQLNESIRKEIEAQIDGIIPLVKKIDFAYTDYGRLYKIRVYDERYYDDLEQVFDNIGIELSHDDLMDVS